MADIKVLDQHGSFRLIQGDGERGAVIEARDGMVYSMHGHDRREALDTPAGIQAVIEPDGWQALDDARARYEALCKEGDDLSKEMW